VERGEHAPDTLLFICSRNRDRSLTAEHLFSGQHRFLVRSAARSDGARIKVTSGNVRWGEIIFVMESRHHELLQSRFPTELRGKQLVCLFVSDDFTYGEEELITLLQNRQAAHIH